MLLVKYRVEHKKLRFGHHNKNSTARLQIIYIQTFPWLARLERNVVFVLEPEYKFIQLKANKFGNRINISN